MLNLTKSTQTKNSLKCVELDRTVTQIDQTYQSYTLYLNFVIISVYEDSNLSQQDLFKLCSLRFNIHIMLICILIFSIVAEIQRFGCMISICSLNHKYQNISLHSLLCRQPPKLEKVILAIIMKRSCDSHPPQIFHPNQRILKHRK